MDFWDIFVEPHRRARVKAVIRDKPLITGADTIVKTNDRWHLQVDLGSRGGDLEEDIQEPSERAEEYNTSSHEDATLLDRILNTKNPGFKKEGINDKDGNATFQEVYFADHNTDIGIYVPWVEIKDIRGNKIRGYGSPEVMSFQGIHSLEIIDQMGEKIEEVEGLQEANDKRGVKLIEGHESYLTFTKTMELATYFATQAHACGEGIILLAAVATANFARDQYQAIKIRNFYFTEKGDLPSQIITLNRLIDAIPNSGVLEGQEAMDKLRAVYAP